MSLRFCTVYFALLSCAFAVAPAVAQDAAVVATPSKSATGDARKELDAIRAASMAFVDAFNKKDAKAVVDFWTPNGEFINDAGEIFRGREEIEKTYSEFFQTNPDSKMRLAIDSIRLVSENTAIEDGRAIVDPAPEGAPGTGKYTVVHVKVDGKWKMASVRDTWESAPSAYDNVADLEWLIGTWVAEEHGARTVSVCRWLGGKSFVERKYTITHPDGAVASGVQIIGWDPQAECVKSWNFSSDGGHAIGIWTPTEGGWSAELEGTTGDGTATKAVNTLTRLDDNGYVWQSTQRMLGEEELPDTDEVVLKRQRTATADK
jgi:uncharacterized protein (TIGR02246 family)